MKQEPIVELSLALSAPRKAAPSSNLSRALRSNFQELLALLGGSAIWEALGWSLGLQWLPPFSTVLEALLEFLRSGVIFANLGSSLQALFLGFALSLVFGLVLGALMGRYRAVEKALDVYVHALF